MLKCPLLVLAYQILMYGMDRDECPYESSDPFDAPEACSWQAIQRAPSIALPSSQARRKSPSATIERIE